jgi:hypothetical protein
MCFKNMSDANSSIGKYTLLITEVRKCLYKNKGEYSTKNVYIYPSFNNQWIP